MAEAKSPSKQQMFEAEMANQALERIQEYLQQLDRQMADVLSMKEAIAQLQHIKEGDDMLVPMAAGVFMKAQASAKQELLVNVGNGVLVPKDTAGVQAMLDEQLGEMRKYQEELHRQFDEGLKKLQDIERSMA